MSARNYTDCPKCREIVKTQRQDRFTAANKAYGQVPQMEFEEMVRTAKETKERTGTLAEYYEWEFTSGGKWWMRYSCSCTDCGFAFENTTQADFRI